ncbi:Conserved oligomeric Golgi complex subunit 1 [Gracilaria domingensis]|nr:Conserved oligomeric Golgi complex subunit 1 [Gracilaria domingensis]
MPLAMAKPQSRASQGVLTTGSVPSEVTHLFRTKRVSDIRAFEAQIRNDAEDKSSALRDLLGTRYKDILNAADEMVSMRDASVRRVRDSLRDFTTSTNTLKQHFISKGNQNQSETINDDLERRRGVHVVGSRLKHIVDSPEVLYANIESGEIYEAAVRYSLAFENYKQVTSTSGLEGVANRFAELQWKQVKGFKHQILEAAEKKLQESGHTAQEYARVFVSLILLSENRDIVAILDGMLASRTGLIWNEDQAKQFSEVHLQMKRIATLVRETISCVSDMFWGENGVQTLLHGVNDQAIDEVSRLKDKGALNSACNAWTRNVRGWLEERGSSILSGADTSRQLADTLRAIDDAFDYDHWESDCQKALQESPNFVFDIFKPFIRDRAGVVARECIERTVNKVLEDIDGAWADIEARAHAGKRIWAVISGKAVGPSIITEETNGDSQRPESVEIAQILSCNGQVTEVLGTFDESVKEAVADVQVLTKRIPAVSEDFVNSVRASLPRILSNLKERMSSIPVDSFHDRSKKDDSPSHFFGCALFVAWLSTAFRNAEGVRKAYYFAEYGKSTEEDLQAYKEFQQTAEELCSTSYSIWAKLLVVQLGEKLLSDLVAAENLKVKMGWSSSIMSNKLNVQNDDRETPQHPTTASTPLVNFLLNVNTAARRAGGFALPRDAIAHLQREIINTSIRSYKGALDMYCIDSKAPGNPNNLSDDEREGKRDVVLMQMLFDVQVVHRIFSNVRKDSRSDIDEENELKKLESSIHSKVDPNAISNCNAPFQEAVFNYASRTCVLLGLLSQCSPGETSRVKSSHSATSVNTSSNLVALAKTVPRFTYLPAPMPSTYSITVGAPSGLNTKTIGIMRNQVSNTSTSTHRKRDPESSVADYASKVTESVGRFGRGFFESFTRKVT